MAQLNCNVTLYDIANAEDIATLADVNMSFDNATSVAIVTAHLKSVYSYAGADFTNEQLAETALSILASYWFLNLAELCIFFSQLKAGSRGQFVWGSRVNNQAIMVALSDFCQDRRKMIEKRENEALKQQMEKGYARLDSCAAAIVTGLESAHEAFERAKDSLEAFCELFPALPATHTPEIWWKAWNGENVSLKFIYGEKVPVASLARDDIGRFLCEYNIYKNKNG